MKIKIRIENEYIKEIVYKSYVRSFGKENVSLDNELFNILITDKINPGTDSTIKKIILLGNNVNLKKMLTPSLKLSELKIIYHGHEITDVLYLKERFFERFDFTNEWNNLGYGRIELNNSPWGIFHYGALTLFKSIAKVYDNSGAILSDYAGILDEKNQSILWFNRPVGPVDGFDWRIVEEFIENYRSDELSSLKAQSELPKGCSGAVSIRIDCDENIESGRPLFELYKKYNIPFSLAIKTDQVFSAESIALMKEVINKGGAILSHSHTHISDWGGDGKSVLEYQKTLDILSEYIPNYKIEYAVSPFHQNSIRAIKELSTTGLKGFIGGIIHNDPEYLMARKGLVPFSDNLISHSQQCMLHGDCYHNVNNSIEVYKEAFKNAFHTKTLFGFLDHPFSNYQYGWHSEEERLRVHEGFIQFIKSYPVEWVNSVQCF